MNRLKELRKEKGLTLDEMAEQVGIKRGTINNYENEKTEPKLETWKELADFFDVSIGYIQGTSNTRTNLVDEVTDILFEKYIEHESYTDDKNETTIIFDLNDFHQKINKYCDIYNIDLEARNYSSEDEDNESSEFNFWNDFQSKLKPLIVEVALLYQYQFSKNDNSSGFADEDHVIEIATNALNTDIDSVTKHEQLNKKSLGGLLSQLEDLNKALSDRDRLITDNNWNVEDENGLIDNISYLKELSTEVLDDILENL